MSSGGILIAPPAVAAAAAAATVLAAGAAAVLVARAANMAAEAAFRAVGDYGARLEGMAAAQSDAEITRRIWGVVAADAVELNSRISALRARAAKAGVQVDIPTPLSISGCTATEASRRAELTAQLVAQAQAAVRIAVAGDEARHLGAYLPQYVLARPDAAKALKEYQQMLQKRRGPSAAVAGASETPMKPTPADVKTVLETLDPDADEREHLDVLAAAACVAQDDAREARSYLESLRAKVTAVNAAASRRRLAGQWLVVLEEQSALGDPPTPFSGTAAKLRAVVAGDRDLSADLRAEAAEAAEWADAQARCHFVKGLMHSCLTDLGYSLEPEFDVRNSAELRLARPDWGSEHSAEIWIDSHGALHGRVVRAHDLDGDEAAARERERCDGFNADIRTLGSRLGAAVVTDEGYVPDGFDGAATGDVVQPGLPTYHDPRPMKGTP
ncbi:hypothetical protein [Catenulispora rubra]|uniref:hypothetical protein n=1 Tax=Catenulispora rubra TaxID=280293 RepID=UPI0018924368|nr:hypothetical protein [Catenulispora rubra]